MCAEPLEENGAPCMFFELGYPWCRSCAEHHRAPECSINEKGQSLSPDGMPWADLGMPTERER